MKSYEDFLLQEEQLDESSLGGITRSISRRGVKKAQDDYKKKTQAEKREKHLGDVGKAYNEIEGKASNIDDAKSKAKTTRALARHGGKKMVKSGGTAAKVAKGIGSAYNKATSAVKGAASKVIGKEGLKTAGKVASKTLKGIGSVANPLNAAATGAAIADATFRNKDVQQAYANYSPKAVTGVGPGKTKNVYGQQKPQQSTYSKELGAAASKVKDTASKVKDTLTAKPTRGRSGAKRSTGK